MTQETDLIFVVPTYRLRDVCETVETYDENFWNEGEGGLLPAPQ